MDLIIKRKEDHVFSKKYHFWIRELNEDRYDTLIKGIIFLRAVPITKLWLVYFKTTQLFIFVYSIDDRESFIKLTKAIADVIDETPKRKFCGILIANKNNNARVIFNFKFFLPVKL